jgi:hypothetical protein
VGSGQADAVIHAGDFAYDFEGEYFVGDALAGGRRAFTGRAGDRFMEQIGTYAKQVCGRGAAQM